MSQFVLCLFCLLVKHFKLACQSQHVDGSSGLKRSVFVKGAAQISYGNFVADKFHRLQVSVGSSTTVMSYRECAMSCVNTPTCASFNVASLPDADGKFRCELLNEDKYNSLNHLISSQEYHHFSIKTACSSYPCKNNGKCVPNYGNNQYHCDCVSGYDGRHCQTDIDECSVSPTVCHINANCQNNAGSYLCSCKPGYIEDGKTCKVIKSCGDIKRIDAKASDGSYISVSTSTTTVQVYCDMTTSGQGWTLVARFSNNDAKNWMEDSGDWWYDKNVAVGETTEPLKNTDMISQAFWLVSGNEFKITSSNDPQHTALLQTTGNCLGGQTFRSKITSYGDYRNGTVWSNDQCPGNCMVQYGGQYQTTSGFKQATCSGSIQSANAVGFWCNWSTGDGAVMMIGGGGSECQRADHGIGITEADQASFNDGGTEENDFGNEADNAQSSSYSLNLWVR